MSEEKVLKKFGDFGKAILVIAICTVLNLIPYISFATSIVSFIFMIMAIGHIKKANETLNDNNVKEFRSRYLLSYILTTIGTIGMLIVLILMVFTLFGMGFIDPYGNTPSNISYEDLYILLDVIFFYVGIIGFFVLILFVAAAFEMKAWNELNGFFTRNRKMFPEPIIRDAIDGTRNLKNATLCILLFFLVITPIIGLVLRIIGYFRLSKLKDLALMEVKYTDNQQAQSEEDIYSPLAIPTTETSLNFCPFCGSKIEVEAKFCAKCGSKL